MNWNFANYPSVWRARALEDVDTERLRTELERTIFGTLPDAPLALDGLDLESTSG